MGGQSYKRLFTDHLCPEICIVCISVKPLSEKLLTKIVWNCIKIWLLLSLLILLLLSSLLKWFYSNIF